MAMTGDGLRRRPQRLWLIVLLLVLGVPQSPLMAMPAPMPHAGAHVQHALSPAAHPAAMKHAAHHHGHPNHCPQCGVCGACYSAASAVIISALHLTAPPPAVALSASLPEVYLSPDPFPPRR
jgi:hypothetical protein